MRPGAWFATVLVPNSTFKELAKDPGTTSSFKRPLYSLVASNPAYGMYLGQVADINKLGNAFVYEDICASNSDKDYNDLIFQITGAATADIQTLDSLAWKVPAKTRAARRDWTDWRTDSELGRQIMEHLEALQSVNSETERITVTLDAPADIQISDSEGGVIGKEGGYIAGALFGTDENGNKYVSLIKSESGEYRVVVQGLGKDEAALLNVKEYKGESEISSVSLPFATAPHQTLSTVVSTGASASVPVPVGCVYDFDGDSDIDIADVMKVASIWGTGMGNEEYDGFYDLNDSGKIELSDIMKVVNLEGCKQ